MSTQNGGILGSGECLDVNGNIVDCAQSGCRDTFGNSVPCPDGSGSSSNSGGWLSGLTQLINTGVLAASNIFRTVNAPSQPVTSARAPGAGTTGTRPFGTAGSSNILLLVLAGLLIYFFARRR